jgi:hypothetical protein
MRLALVRTLAALALVAGISAPAFAQIEVGASLVGVTFLHEDSGGSLTGFGVPSGSVVGLFTPGSYVGVFLTSHVAVEGGVGALTVSGDGESVHVLNAAGQVNWIVKGEKNSSPYLFGSVGVLHATDSDAVATYGAGGGYRFKCGDRLVLRLQGRYTRVGSGGGNVFDFGVSIGGLFGKK